VNLSGKVVLITGGSRMGASLAQAFAAAGADVALSYSLSGSVIAGVVDTVVARGCRGRALPADLRDPTACQSLVDEVVAWAGRLDVVICLASVYERVGIDALTPETWRTHLAVDLDSSFHCARAAAAAMQRQGAGHIILCSDWVAASGRARYTGYVPYYVAKAGIIALTEALALELAPARIQVNAIAPGPILPAAGSTPEMQAAVLEATPLGRWGGPEVLTHAVMGLLEQDWVTGQVVRVDGGRHLK
jgi:NAD(P)-dependent dehydrogenase (short-subunit alcohol dehydrogenase family)